MACIDPDVKGQGQGQKIMKCDANVGIHVNMTAYTSSFVRSSFQFATGHHNRTYRQ